MTDKDDFKNVYHLVGEQTLPVFIAALQFPREAKHYLLTTQTKKTGDAAKRILKMLEKSGLTGELVYIGKEREAVSVPDLNNSIGKLLDETHVDGEPAAFDLTGGTKPMSIVSLLQVGKRAGMAGYYLDFQGRKLICLNDRNLTRDLRETLTLENFINLGGMNLKTSFTSRIPESSLVYFFKNAEKLQRYQGAFVRCLPGEKPPKGYTQEQYFQEQFEELKKRFNGPDWETHWEACRSSGEFGKKNSWQAQARLLAGGWFENYIYMILKKQYPGLKEIGLNAVLTFPGKQQSAQEFDVVYTDGYSLFILECKAGRIKQEYVQKLENLREHFSGSLGRCALVTLNSSRNSNGQQESFAERVADSRAISAFCGKNGINQLKQKALSFEAGQVYE